MYSKTFDPADVVLEQAITIAQATDRNILIHFYADWCHYCHYLEQAFESCAVKPLLQKQYVLVTLIEDGEEGENPGTYEMRCELGGRNSGVPFMAILDKDGNKLMDSKNPESRRGNIGYPDAAHEIVYFGKMLEATAPKLMETERESILHFFTNAPWRRATLRY